MVSGTDDKIAFINDYKSASNAATGSKYDANANVTVKNIATLSSELSKKDNIALQRAVLRGYIEKYYGKEMADRYIEDLSHHIIYRHDESSGAGGFPYCCAISLYPFLLNGLKDLGGSSLPPQHAASFVGGLINLIFLVAGQFVGAVAIPETLTYFDHFLRKDYGDDYAAHLDDVIETGANRKLTLREKICDWFQQFVYTINQPAGARGYQSVFFNIAYFDKYYFESIFKDFFFPDGDVPSWESTKELQKLFMKWFNKERMKSILTFPVESFSVLVNKETGKYKDEETADFIAEMWAEGHSFFVYQSDSPDSLSSCCFEGNTPVLWKSSSEGVRLTSIKELCELKWIPHKNNLRIYHNGSWVVGRPIKADPREMYKVTTSNHKVFVMTDNHINITLDGEKRTSELTTDDYLMFNTRELSSVAENDENLTFEEGFAIGAFLGDGSFGATCKDGTIYDVNYSQNKDRYDKCMEMVNEANRQLGGENQCRLNTVYNNVYPVRISSKILVSFIQRWTNWKRGTYSYNKELNLDCLLQSVEFRKGILAGWYNTDGGNSNRCYTSSEKLKDCMEVLITSLGMNSIIDCSDRTDEEVLIRGKTYSRNYPLWCVRWYEKTNRNSEGDIYRWRNNSQFFRIIKIEKLSGAQDSYCIERQDQQDPYFTLPGGLITHNCRLRNGIEDNVFSYTLGAGGVETGSKAVITMNVSRIVQDWDREGRPCALSERIAEIADRVRAYLTSFNLKLWDDYNAGLLTVYKAGFISLDKGFLTIGVNGFIEAAEYLGIVPKPENDEYKQFARDILGTLKEGNRIARTEHAKFNTEFVPKVHVGT